MHIWSIGGHFRHVGRKERFSRAFDAKWYNPFACLVASKIGFLLEFVA